MKRALLALVGLFMISMSASARLDIRRVSIDVPDGVALMPAVADDGDFWHGAEPQWHGKNGDIEVRAWLGAAPSGVRLYVVVKDPKHENTFRERSLWRGDCIYVNLDGQGNTPREALEANTFETDDATYIFAIGADGPEGRLSKHGDQRAGNEDVSRFIKSLVRNDAKGETIYDIRIPWEDFNSPLGLSPLFGIALHVAHKNSEKQDTPWGRMRVSKAGPREVNLLRVIPPADSRAVIQSRQLRLPQDEDEGRVSVAVPPATGGILRARLGGMVQERVVDASETWQLFEVVVPAADISETANVLGVALDADGKKEERTFALETIDTQLARVRDRLSVLMNPSPHPVVTEHLRSTLEVLDCAYRNLLWHEGLDAGERDTLLDVCDLLLKKLPADRFDWDAHLRKGLPLVFAFVSEYDHSLQFSMLQFPYGWDESKAYPLVVYLHGAVGNVSPLSGLATAFDNSHQDTLFTEEDIDPENIPPSHRCFVVTPWSRGNSMYLRGGLSDVWQSIAIVKRRYRIDEDRQYITGFSMGCNGAWGIAARRPDEWAGINTASGFGSWSETSLPHLVENAAGIPVVNWIGALDGMVEGARQFQALLESKGFDAELEIVDDLPHTYPYAEFQKNVGKLLKHRRRPRCNVFSFVGDGLFQSERRGVAISVPRLLNPDAMPRFTCRIDGQTVHIDTENTDRVSVDFGDDGLQLQGDVTVMLNGKEAYQGPVQKLRLNVE